MNVYSVTYGSHEDSAVLFFYHEEVYTSQEFEKIVLGAIVFHLKAIKAGDITLSAGREKWPCIHNISDLFWGDITRALEPYGFTRIRPSQSVDFSGWQDPFNFEGTAWCGKDSVTYRLYEVLMEQGFTKADSSIYEADGKMKAKIDHHDADNTICRTCGAQTRDNPLSGESQCWWCPRCGDGCHCDYSETFGVYEFIEDEEIDRQCWYE